MQFTPESSVAGAGDMVPVGTLALAHFGKPEIKNSKATGGTYASAEITLVSGPFAKRKIFINNLMNPDDERNGATARTMGSSAICRMLEACGIFNPADKSTYSRINDFGQAVDAIANYSADGKYVAVKVSIEKGKDGYQDKNGVGTWLTPNPDAGSHKDWAALQALLKEGGGAIATPVAAPAFAAPAASAATPAWGGAQKSSLAAPAWAGGSSAETAPATTAKTDIDEEIPF